MRRSLAPKKILAALSAGDVEALLAFHRETFGDLQMTAGGEQGEDEDNDEDADEDENEDEDDASGDDKSKKSDARVKELSDENAKRRNEAKALKKQNEDLARQLKEFTDKDKSELDKTSSEAAEAKTKAEKLEALNQKLMIENAFYADNKYDWANPKDALKLADLSEVEIDDEGDVTGMAKALEALAKEKPYLLKKKGDDDDEDEDDATSNSTGRRVGKKSKGTADREKLIKKYPALQR